VVCCARVAAVQGACIPAPRQELIEWLKRVVHPAIKTSPGALAAQVMRAQSAVRVGTKIDRGRSSARPARRSVAASSTCHDLPRIMHSNNVAFSHLQTCLFLLQAL
jgi:hypothetical protein